jgi:DNA-binding winged helix-turn-helix (wHTH) protein
MSDVADTVREDRLESRLAPKRDNVRTQYHFGTSFVLDLGAYELRRAGRPLKLPPIPMDVLCILVQQPGQLVSRTQIVQEIWGDEVSIDTDTNINETICQIRRALNDSADRPRYLQTVHRRGYRFIANVTRVEENSV